MSTTRRWLCYEHERVHDESEQAVHCVDGEWIEEGSPEPPVSEFRARWNETLLRARGQHPDQVEATIRALGVCDRRTEASTLAWPEANLPWATSWQRLTGRSCRVRWAGPVYGRARCELVRGHDGEHALDRGMDTPRWDAPVTSTADPAVLVTEQDVDRALFVFEDWLPPKNTDTSTWNQHDCDRDAIRDALLAVAPAMRARWLAETTGERL